MSFINKPFPASEIKGIIEDLNVYPMVLRDAFELTRCAGDNIAAIFFAKNDDLDTIKFGIVIGIEEDLEIRWRKERAIDLIRGTALDDSMERFYPGWKTEYSVISNLVNQDIVNRIKYVNYKAPYHFTFPSIKHFKEAVRLLQRHGNTQPVDLIGYAKVNGVNGTLIFTETEIIKQSKEVTLTVLDPYGLAHHIEENEEAFREWGERLRTDHGLGYPFVVAFEWAGGDIQLKSSVRGVMPFMAVFLIGQLIDGDVKWQKPNNKVSDLFLRAFDIRDFGEYAVTFDPVVPGNTQAELAKLTIEAESVCPVAAFFGIESEVGEGIVWHAKDDTSGTTSLYFKVKGEKHSNVKVRKLAAPNPEKLESVNKFIDYVITENRLEQGVKETGDIDKANMGKFLSWMAKDVMKEESDTLVESGLTWEKVAKQLTSKCMQWYKAKM